VRADCHALQTSRLRARVRGFFISHEGICCDLAP
jgi:hypothetical protein